MRFIRSIIFVIVMSLLFGWMQRLKKENELTNSGENTYVMEVPSILSKLCILIFVIGLVLFIGFSILYYKQMGNVTVGHLNFSLVLIFICLLGFVACYRWKIIVTDQEIKFYNVFKTNQEISVEQIDKVVRGNKGELEIFVSGRKIKTIDCAATHFGDFIDLLERNHIEIDSKQ